MHLPYPVFPALWVTTPHALAAPAVRAMRARLMTVVAAVAANALAEGLELSSNCGGSQAEINHTVSAYLCCEW
jgi:hypothetical protein